MKLKWTNTNDVGVLRDVTGTEWFALPVVPPIAFMAITAWDDLEDGQRTFTIYMNYDQSAIDAAWRARGELSGIGTPVIDEVLGTWRDGAWEELYQEATDWPFADPDDSTNDSVGDLVGLWTGGSFDAVRAAYFPALTDQPANLEIAWNAFMRGATRDEASRTG